MEKILGIYLPKNQRHIFDDLDAAHEWTNISKGYIRSCIKTGKAWKQWCFDIVEDLHGSANDRQTVL